MKFGFGFQKKKLHTVKQQVSKILFPPINPKMAEAGDENSDDVPFGMPASAEDERDEIVETIISTVQRLFDAFSNRFEKNRFPAG
jgi:hypothetical protein